MYNETFIARGDQTQRDFTRLFSRRYPQYTIRVTSAFSKDDLQHIDIWITGRSGVRTFDVKAIKNYIVNETRYQVVELVNNKFHKGWLYGDTDYIAFQSGTSDNYIFLCVEREELRKHCKSNVRMVTVDTKQEAIYKLYSRGDDLITLIDMKYLRYLKGSFVLKKND